jgi:hypothetical protein
VINAAYESGAFTVEQVMGQSMVFFTCFWCGRPVPQSGVEGDHVVTQSCGNSGNAELRELFEEAENSMNPDRTAWNLVRSCSECNGGSRNKKMMMTRGSYKRDRDQQGPVLVV